MWRLKPYKVFFFIPWFVISAFSVSWSDELSGEVRWSGEVVLEKTVMVKKDSALTIAPGTRIKAETPQVKIRVRGRLIVEGTQAEPVVFTGPKGWQGIEFMEAPQGSVIRWAEFDGAAAAISSFATDFTVENCVFKNSEFGVRLLRDSSPEISGSTFENNQIGVANEMKSGAQMRNNRFANHARSAILASHNSWGEITGNTFVGNKQGVTLLQVYKDLIRGNTFIENEVGIYCNQTQSTPRIEANRFEKNSYGILNFSFAYPHIKHNRFIENKTGVHNDQYGSPEVENNLFKGNETALYNYRKSNPKVRLNLFEENDLALFCDFSAYPIVKDNHFVDNGMGVKLGIYQSADWEERSGSKAIMQKEAAARQSQNPLLANVPDTFNDYVDVSGNWWGDQTAQLAKVGENGNSPFFFDRHDKPEVTYENYGPGVYRLDWVKFSPWLEQPVAGVGPAEAP